MLQNLSRKSLIIVAAVIIALIMADGCKGKDNETQVLPDIQMRDAAVPAGASVEDTGVPADAGTPPEIMKVYHLEVVNPPSGGWPRVGASVINVNGGFSVDFVYLNTVDGNRNMFYFQAPEDAEVTFDVTIAFKPGECRRPSESLYCDKVRLFAGTESQAAEGRLPRVNVILDSAMTDVDDVIVLHQKGNCEMFFPIEQLEEWEPRACIYRQGSRRPQVF
ncbi:MAG TPA: hypothetical protein VLK22_01275 [Candidatus Udaeobacter sp.]|nr:hypothetical protein [Candidatus Udaeobacter sp.]